MAYFKKELVKMPFMQRLGGREKRNANEKNTMEYTAQMDIGTLCLFGSPHYCVGNHL